MNQASPSKSLAKNQLLVSAMKLFLKYGVKSVSMDDIARMLGISKKTIYNHISNKKGLVKAAVEIFIEQEHKIIKQITENSVNAVDEMVLLARQFLNTVQNMKPTLTYDLKKYHPETWQLIEDTHFRKMQTIITDNLERGKREGYYRPELHSEIIAALYLGLSKLISTDESLKKEDIDIKEYYESMILYHLHGIINEIGKKELTKYLKNKTI